MDSKTLENMDLLELQAAKIYLTRLLNLSHYNPWATDTLCESLEQVLAIA